MFLLSSFLSLRAQYRKLSIKFNLLRQRQVTQLPFHCFVPQKSNPRVPYHALSTASPLVPARYPTLETFTLSTLEIVRENKIRQVSLAPLCSLESFSKDPGYKYFGTAIVPSLLSLTRLSLQVGEGELHV